MAVSLKRGLWSYVRKHSDSFWLQLATDDDERAAAALERAVEAIRSVPHPNEPDEPAVSYVSDIEMIPGGPCVMCDFKDLPDRILRQALDAVVASLDADGIEGTLQPPLDRKDAPFFTVLADGHHTPPYPGGWALLVAREEGPYPATLPQRWVEPLRAWLLDGGADDDELFWASVVAVSFRLPVRALPGFLARPTTISQVACGDVSHRLRWLYLGGKHLVIAERGPAMQGDALDRSADGLVALARELAPDAPYVALDFPGARTRFGEHRFPVNELRLARVSRPHLPGAYPWQVLGRPVADFLHRLPDGAAWIDDSHVEIAFGPRRLWTDRDRRVAVEVEAEAALAPLLPATAVGTWVHGAWASCTDFRRALDTVGARVWLDPDRGYGDAFGGVGAFVDINVFGDPPSSVRLRPNNLDRSLRLMEEVLDALRQAADGEVTVIRSRPQPFERFLDVFRIEEVPPRTSVPPLPAPLVAEGFGELLGTFGGASFRDGVYRLLDADGVDRWTTAAGAAFPEHKGSILCFASDWLGRLFALDARRDSQVLLLDAGAGAAHEVPRDFRDFHDVELVEESATVFEAALFKQWRAAGGTLPEPEQCIGFRVPLFLGGNVEAGNLEPVDMALYWDLCAQLRAGTRRLPPGTTIGGLAIG